MTTRTAHGKSCASLVKMLEELEDKDIEPLAVAESEDEGTWFVVWDE